MLAWLRNPVAIGIGLLLLAILAASTFAIVPETKQAVIVEFEKPLGTVNRWRPGDAPGRSGAGLLARWPFIDRIIWIDKRVLDVDLENQPVLSSDQYRLEVDAFARFRIVDPLRLVLATGLTSDAEQRVATQLQPLFSSALRNELSKRNFAELLSPERGQLMDNIQVRLQRLAAQYGVEIVDVRIKHADLPDGSPLDSALERMRSARRQQALAIRANGAKEAQIIVGDADAQAARIYADAFNQDPDFYNFLRAMQSYRKTFGADGSKTPPAGSTTLVLTPDNGYLKEFEGVGAGGGRTPTK